MPVAPDFTSVFSKNWEINFTQCTPNGCLKYTELCNLLQLTAADHSILGGISFTDMQAFDQAWVLSRMRVEIDTLPKWRDTVTIKTWIISLENSRSVRALEMHLNGKKIVGCETFWAVFNTQKRRPEALALPDDHFEKFPDWNATSERVKRIEVSEDLTLTTQRNVVVSDLDIVDHVNNVKYLEWCLDGIKPERILNNRLKSFDMNFLKELVLNDAVQITFQDTASQSIFAVLKDDKPCFALELNWNPLP